MAFDCGSGFKLQFLLEGHWDGVGNGLGCDYRIQKSYLVAGKTQEFWFDPVSGRAVCIG